MRLCYTVTSDDSKFRLWAYLAFILDDQQTALYCQKYLIVLGRMLRQIPHLLSKLYTQYCIFDVYVAITFCQYSQFVSNKCQKMLNFTTFTKIFAKLSYTIFSICDSCLITSDHLILIGCTKFLQVSRSSNCDVANHN